MARTKRKVNPIIPASVPEIETPSAFHVAGYVRLSIEDSGRPGADTLESQRELVLSYIDQQPDMQLHSFYCDETDIIGLNQNPRHLGVDLVLFSRIQNKFQMNGGVTAY